MTREQIEQLDGAELYRTVLVRVLGVPEEAAAQATLASPWEFVGQVQEAMDERGWWMRLESPWIRECECLFVCEFFHLEYGGQWCGAFSGLGPAAWVAVGRAALLALEGE